MSNIPKAREIIQMVLQICPLDAVTRRHLHRALAMMTREPPIRRAKAKRVKITAAIRRQIHSMSAQPDTTMFDIAAATGVRNQARISDVLHGKR